MDKTPARSSHLRSGYCERGCHHPHIHCLVPVGGLAPDRNCWVQPRYRFFLPLGVLKKVFRGKFLDGLKRAYRRNKLNLGGATGDSTDSVIEMGPGGGFNRGKGLLGDAAGSGASDSGAVKMFGAPGGGGLGPKGPVFGNGGNARRITFVCDATGTMLPKMEALKVELSKVVHDLKPIQAFNVIFFHEEGAYALDRNALTEISKGHRREHAEG